MSATPTSGVGFFKQSLRKNWSLYLLVLPVLIYFIIFLYLPMYGVIIAFKDFSPGLGIWGSKWVGLKHFVNFFHSMFFGRVLRNTLGISLYSLAVGFPFPIILAIMMNELRSNKFKSTMQTITYLPHFISIMVMCGMINIFFRMDSGPVNLLIKALGGQSIAFLNEPAYFKSLYVWTGLWQNAGWNTIIYMATLSGLDVQMFEAASIDGASKMQKIWYITLPCLMPTAILLLILDSGSLMNVGFEKIFLLQNPLNLETSDVISTLVYRKGITETDFSYSAAIGLFNSVINCIILVVVNQIGKKFGDTSLW